MNWASLYWSDSDGNGNVSIDEYVEARTLLTPDAEGDAVESDFNLVIKKIESLCDAGTEAMYNPFVSQVDPGFIEFCSPDRMLSLIPSLFSAKIALTNDLPERIYRSLPADQRAGFINKLLDKVGQGSITSAN